MTCHARAPLTRCYALILATILLSCVRVSGALAADLTLFEGTWNGNWVRTSDPEKGSSGTLTTTFAVRHNRLTGMHYGYEIEKVEVEGRTVIFQHPYGSCRATHTFTIDLEDPNKADSTYQVENCPEKTLNHTGAITYTKGQEAPPFPAKSALSRPAGTGPVSGERSHARQGQGCTPGEGRLNQPDRSRP